VEATRKRKAKDVLEKIDSARLNRQRYLGKLDKERGRDCDQIFLKDFLNTTKQNQKQPKDRQHSKKHFIYFRKITNLLH
jgi:hypothetical protein